jgi:hypothetical protein
MPSLNVYEPNVKGGWRREAILLCRSAVRYLPKTQGRQEMDTPCLPV